MAFNKNSTFSVIISKSDIQQESYTTHTNTQLPFKSTKPDPLESNMATSQSMMENYTEISSFLMVLDQGNQSLQKELSQRWIQGSSWKCWIGGGHNT